MRLECEENKKSSSGNYAKRSKTPFEDVNNLEQKDINVKTVHLYNIKEMKTNKVYFQPAYHGTPHKFEKFSTEKIGTGEGAQAHGWGLYFAKDNLITRIYSIAKKEFRKYIDTINKSREVVYKFVSYIQRNNYSFADELDEKGRKLYNDYKFAALELDADNTALLIQWYKGNRNEKEIRRYAELLGFEHENKLFYSTRQDRTSRILSKADYYEQIKEFNRRRNHNRTKDIVLINYISDNDNSNQDIYLQEITPEENEQMLMAGFKPVEVAEKLEELYGKQETITDENREFQNELMAKIHVLEDAFEVVAHPEKFTKDVQDDIMLNTYYIMNDEKIPKSYIEADKMSLRSYNDYKKAHDERIEQEERSITFDI